MHKNSSLIVRLKRSHSGSFYVVHKIEAINNFRNLKSILYISFIIIIEVFYIDKTHNKRIIKVCFKQG